MAVSIISRLSVAFQNVERAVICSIFGRFPPPDPVFISPSHCIETSQNSSTGFSIKDVIGDGFLYAVPKFRRTVEKRLKRRFGVPKYVWKPLVPKNNLRVCNTCGHHHEVGILCGEHTETFMNC